MHPLCDMRGLGAEARQARQAARLRPVPGTRRDARMTTPTTY